LSDPTHHSAARLLRRIVKRLSCAYEFDRLGNLDDPLDELVYIVLSTRTRGSVFERTFLELKSRFPTWESAARSRPGTLERLLKPAGLAKKKASWLRQTLREIRRREGRITLENLQTMTTSEAEAYLTSLPGVGVKTARCVLMYSLGREVFPVDANTRRLLERLKLISPLLHYQYAHDEAQELVPKPLREHLHIYAVIHGRKTCLPRNPKCSQCVISDLCPSAPAYALRERT
jgi:endonuclease-3